MTHTLATVLAAAVSHLTFAQAQSTETVWSSVLVTLYGDRAPLISSGNSLTPLGAQQLYSAGSLFRDRYIAPSSSNASSDLVINGISPFGKLVSRTDLSCPDMLMES